MKVFTWGNCTDQYWEDDGIYYEPDCNYNETIYGARETKNFPFNGWITKDRELTIWGLEKYRKVSYFFDKEVTYGGIPMYKFTCM